MRLLREGMSAGIALGFLVWAGGFASAQTSELPQSAPGTLAQSSSGATSPASAQPTNSPQASGAVPQTATSEKRIYTVPAGTKVLLQLRSAINTKSARVGDGVYLASTFPVVVGNRVMIPAGVYVQGVVDRVERAGRVKGKAQLDMHFTSIIFPNGTVVEIPGMVNSLPGARKQEVKDNGEGTIEQDSDKGRNAGKTAEIAIPTGGRSVRSVVSVLDIPLRAELPGLEPGSRQLVLSPCLRAARMSILIVDRRWRWYCSGHCF